MSESLYRVLVADDDVGCRNSLISLLSLEGFKTFSVEGGRQVLERIDELRRALHETTREDSSERDGLQRDLHEQTIHFLVLDYNMPDLSGLEVLRKMRVELRITLPTILVTGEFTPDLERSVKAEGGFALVPKPVEPQPFRQLVWRLVKSRLMGDWGALPG